MKTDEKTLRSYLKRVTIELHQTRESLRELENRRSEPIAIVGMSCRYPGGISSPSELWQLLSSGTDAIAEFPGDRGWDVESLHDPDLSRPRTSYVTSGAFLQRAGEFDASFFGISPREALAMDPQQRLLLEGAWEALEDAGLDPAALRGSQTGVFAGVMNSDYGVIGATSEDLEGYLATGIAGSVASGRIAYTFGFEGPAVSIDTACSSSLVAIHLACQALRNGECSLALAGGVTVMSTPATIVELSRQHVLSPDGRCKAFGDGADGMGTSEGMGVVLLEPLSKAQAEGHEVLAVVRGSATNQDGASNGLTAPNGPSQERVIAQALANAGLTPADIDAVEAHGTGTALGDPIEAQALLATYGQERENGPLRLGSIKSNIGHTQAAAGVAGVIKMVQAMRHGALPRTLHADPPSKHIEWDAGEVELLTEEEPWEANGHPRRAGVSSFGISGTNAHLILEEAPTPEEAEAERQPDSELGDPLLTGPLPFLLSAKTEPALREQAARLAAHLREHPELEPDEVAARLALGRPHLEHRAVLVAGDRERALAGLDDLAAGKPSPDVVAGRATTKGKLAFLFPGQGSQWQGMALELWDSSPAFAKAMRECEEALAPHVDWSLEAVLRGEAGAATLDRVDVVQPALFAVMVSLAGLWRCFGVEPAAVVGHSQGEIAAAHVAGALSLEDAARVIALRAKALAEELSGKGGMLSIAIGADEARSRIEPFGGRISLAAVNGPAAVVVSGEPGALEELLAELEAEEIRARMIPVDYAAHSHQIEAIEGKLLEGCAPIEPQAAAVPFLSAVAAEPLPGEELDAEYWYRNLRETAQFERATELALEQGHRAFVEVSPHPVLAMAVQESAERALPDSEAIAAIGSLRRDQGGPERFCLSLAELWVSGGTIDWKAAFGGSAKRVPLPTYPFQRERFWIEGSLGAGDVAAAGLASTEHPLLGAAVALADGEGWLFTGRISTESHSWLADHAVMGTVLLPGTAFLELALHAGSQVGLRTVEELVMQAPLVLPEGGAVQLQVSLGAPDEEGKRAVEIYSRSEDSAEEQVDGEWTLNASGHLADADPKAAERLSELTWPPEGAEPIEVEDLYDQLAAAGFEYGPAFQGLLAAWRRGEDLFAEVSLPESERQGNGSFEIHPALLDAALHGAAAAMLAGDGDTPAAGLPFAWNGVSLYASDPSGLRVRLSRAPGKDGAAKDAAISLQLADGSGAPLGSVRSLVTRPISDAGLLGAGAGHYESLFRLEWVGVEADGVASPASIVDHADLADLPEEESVPELVLFDTAALGDGELPAAAHAALHGTLELIQSWISEERFANSQLVLLTHGAIAARPGEQVADLAAAPLWGLVRSAQSEHPERFALLDVGDDAASEEALPAALSALASLGETQLALRGGELFAPRMARATSGGALAPPPEAAWRLEGAGTGTLEDLALLPCEEAAAPLAGGQVRVAVHAAGMNFRDVLIALGMYPDAALIGSEGAGVVAEVGPEVEGLEVGDRVMGLIPGCFGPLAITDQHLLAKVPDGWSYAEAAAVPTVFLTATYALFDLADLKKGEKLLVHAAAGGVGMAALQLARQLGAEVFATAHPDKWGVLEGLGIDADHIASSRDAEFKEKFLEQTGGEGVDVVLDSLAGDLIDASLDLLPRGGRFIEMGKTDLRDAEGVAADHPGVAYRAFDMAEAGPERIGEMLAEVLDRFEAGDLEHLPVKAFDLRHSPDAFRFMREARHVGKIVLSVPRPLDAEGTALVTGGTGVLGSLIARHLAGEHGVGHLVLASRQGPTAEGAKELEEELRELGAEVTIAACDVSDREQLAALIDSIPAAHPLRAVIHTAGALDDGTIDSLTPERLDTVLSPKADAAWHLHELTAGLDLDAFVVFSSVAATVGSPGQGNYAAANTFLDALAAHRRAEGLPATSLAWGFWAELSGLTGGLREEDLERMQRAGVGALSSEEGLALFDATYSAADPLMLPVRLDIAKLRAGARAGAVPPLLRGLLRSSSRSAVEGGSLARRLAGVPEAEREGVVLDLLRSHIATVLGHSSAEAIEPDRNFKELGFDSLAAVEIRNRLNAATGKRLPATLVFDYPTPAALAGYLVQQVEGAGRGARAVRSLPTRTEEPIAIVGMSCRYPGGVSSPDALWQLLSTGTDAVAELPGDRGWDTEALHDPDLSRPGTSYVTSGAFLQGAGEFDASFFGISPREALAMDPQQRLLLEGTWEALEDAGIDPASLRGTETGVFAGVMSSDYGVVGSGVTDGDLEGYLATGIAGSVASGRIAYTFGFEGPAVSVDTACSSSLVAIHLACQALRSGECSLALAGGVTVMSTPAVLVELSRQHVLAPDGRCKAFGAEADGMGTSEGMGIVLLEPLSRAEEKGHEVLAVVRGSATNQDGASNGLTAPNGPSQERVIAQALANSGLSPAEIDVVEAHGTGTALGDPIEAQALLATYGQERSDGPLRLGSIKSNIGHTQAAAGVAGVIKMVQAMRHGELPRTLHADPPSEHIEWDAGEVELLAEEEPWEPNGRPRRAGVSSFGISGTNAHLILEEAPALQEAEEKEQGEPLLTGPPPFLLSAKSEPALREQASRLAACLRERPELEPSEVAAGLALGRSHLEHRAVIVASEREQLLGALDALAAGRPSTDVIAGRATTTGKLAFLFPGQGSQWEGMAVELWDSSPAFAKSMRECEEALAPYVDWSLESVLRGEEGAPSLDRVDVVQPALFAVMVALARLWRSFGIRPSVLIGHSQGEIAAAHVAGALSLEDAARVIALRAKALAGELAGKGGMLSIAIGAEEARSRIEPFDGRISLAAVNGSAAVVVSGEPQALEELLAELEAEEVRARMIPVDYAAHSRHVEAVREELLEGCAPIEPGETAIPFLSAVIGEPLAGEELDAEYWYRNLRETVQFERATAAALEQGSRAFVELSPHPVLAMAVQESAEAALPDEAIAAIGSLRREDGGPERFLASLAEAHVQGIAIDWKGAFESSAPRRVPLPTYPFQRERFWLESKLGAGNVAAAGLVSTEHSLLGAAVALADGESWLFTGRISTESHPWLADHAVMGTVLLPGTAFLELALHAGSQVGLRTVEELVLQAPLVLPESGAVQLQVSLVAPDEDARRAVEIYSRVESELPDGEEAGEWTLNASGHLADLAPQSSDRLTERTWPPEGAEPIEVEDLYDRLAAAGFEYGPTFQGLLAAWQRGDELFAEVALPEDGRHGSGSFEIHPALLDAALHVAGAAMLAGDGEGEAPAAGLPFAWSGVSLQGSDPSALRVRLSRAADKNGSSKDAAISLQLADESGAHLGSVRSLVTRPVTEAGLLGAGAGHYESLFRLEWAGVELDAAPSPAPVVDHAELADLAEDETPPQTVVFDTASLAGGEELPAAAHGALHELLALIQGWLSEERFASSRLVVLTHGAVSTRPGEEVGDLAAAPLWGLVRSAQSEHPERFALLDVDDDPASEEALPAAVEAAAALGEPQLALRGGELFAPRVARATSGGALAPPAEAAAWRLEGTGTGTLEDLALLPCEEAAAPLSEGQVRVAVRAAGLNFRDVLIALGMYPDPALIGGEGAGTVAEVGPGVEGLDVGDRVMGLVPGCFGPLGVTDARLLAKVPAGWSYARAASVPTAFLTATYALFDLAQLKKGEKLLVHAAAGGVGMAALQLARALGTEVYATAHPSKWGVLEELGIDPSHIASSRDAEFKEKFLEQTGGEGVDVVLDSLAGDLIDASLDLLPRGGRFIEMGKTDLRDAEEVAAEHPGVAYRAFDMAEAGPERIGEMLSEIVDRFERGELEPLPVKAFDLRHAPDAFRFMREARHVGKIVLSVPQPPDPEGTALVTGGTGVLGSLIARHLAGEHSIGHLVLASRQGPEAEGAKELEEELRELGAEVTIAACDVSDRAQVEKLLSSVPPEHPLKTVVHTAGALDDGTIDSLTPERLDTVLAPKADAAWYLHELTAEMDLDAFVTFSSAAATVGSPGQGNYAAANAFLDALAAQRRAEGLPATSLAWGLWAELSGLTGGLREEDLERMQRAGVGALSSEEGLALFDATYAAADPLMLPVRLDIARLRAGARAGAVPPLLRGLLAGASRQAVESGSLARRLAGVPEEEREGVVLELLRSHIATVLGHSSADAIDPESNFKDLGFDSLAAVEIRNRLNAATGKRLPATLVFDYPTPAALAGYLVQQVDGSSQGARVAQQLPTRTEEPIAIVGMSCRYPGGVSSPQELWQLLSEGGDATTDLPDDRGWDVEALHDPDLSRPGTSYVTGGAFLRDVGEFDAEFFGISPREALAMDPQHRLLLEGAWEALEDAGLDPTSLRGSQGGVFAGVINSDYGLLSRGLRGDLEGYLGIGNTASVASGRIAYSLGFEGPAVSIDTACSSSLVAIHLACQALRSGECSLALAGGVTVMSTPAAIVELSRQRVLAKDGRCKAFGAAADGMGTSEGMGIVLLEPLSRAEEKGHEVLAVVRGSATNQDGASNGLTAPNGPSQERVIAQALANSGLTPAEIDAVEAHGTGTALGDPIEAQALLATYGQERSDGPLRLGSVKSNIGHTQAAAGVAGVIKMVQAMRHGALPRTLHADPPSEHIEWDAGEVELLNEEQPWKPNGHPRRAGVSSFGISGTNAHLILEEAPAPRAVEVEVERSEGPVVLEDAPLPFLLSAKDGEALKAQGERLAAHLRADPELDLTDLAYSLATTRTAFGHRAVLVAEDRERLLAALDALAVGKPAAGVIMGRAQRQGKLAFLFSGQGSQRVGMGKELYESSPVFRAALDEAVRHLDAELGSERSLLDVIWDAEASADLNETLFAQTGLFALEIALFRLLESLGVKPDLLLGHSIGELAAAHVAGVLSTEDACKLVAARARLMQELPAGGSMVAVQAAERDVLPLLSDVDGSAEHVCVAAVNGPASVVLSGEEEVVLKIAKELGEQGMKTKVLKVSRAFHSPRMEPMLEEFERIAAGLSFAPPKVPIASNVTGEEGLAEQMRDPGYWARHAREPVRFADGVSWLRSQGVGKFLELGPDGVLSAIVQECLRDSRDDDEAAFAAPLMRRQRPEAQTFLSSLAELWVSGGEVGWERAFAGTGAKRVPLPTYPFQRERFWLEGEIGLGEAAAVAPATVKPSLPDEPQWLVGHLAGTPPEEREQAIVEAIRAQLAAILGHEVPEKLDAKTPFLELGMDSLAAVELQIWLELVSGLHLSPMLLTEYQSLDEFAGYMRRELEPEIESAEEPAEEPEPEVVQPTEPEDWEALSIDALFRRSLRLGQVDEGMALLESAATLRPVFEAPLDEEEQPPQVRLCQGEKSPKLICIPSSLAGAGPHQYARFAKPFRDLREVSVCPLPGFLRGERLPEDLEVLLATQAEAVRRCGGEDGSFVLFGHSTGGLLAHALAAHLAADGGAPAGLVLVDTYPKSTATALLPEVFDEMVKRDQLAVVLDDTRLTAMATYGRLLKEYEPGELDCPTLHVTATEPLEGVETEEWKSTWKSPHTVQSPGNHFTMMEEHAPATAEVVETWIAEL